jgi:hypothetical protein
MTKHPDDRRPVIDSAKGRPNPYIDPRWTGNARRLDDDVAREFPDSASVNEALRLVIAVRKLLATKRRPGRRKAA